jgi:ribosomal protein S18 acetylase RimI-like enzyme
VEIRRATEADFEAIAELCVKAYAPFVGDDHHYMAELRKVAPRAASAQLLVAGDGSSVLGTVTFVPDGGPLGEIATPQEAEFRMLAVDERARGRGVGMALTEHVLQAARSAGKAGIVCSTLPEMHAAHRIYERLGLARARERDWSPVPGVDLLAYAQTF